MGFLDETGAISRDRIFAVGLLKMHDAARVLRRIQKLRDRSHHYDEFKFTSVRQATLPLFRQFVDVVLGESDVEFFCFVSDTQKADPTERFGTHWEAYGKLAEQLTVASLRSPELMTVVADNYSTPDEVLFEDVLKASVNRR